MKKRIILIVAIIALVASLATVLCACNIDQEIDLDTMTAAEALTSVSKLVWDDDVKAVYDWERTNNITPSIYDTGSETEAYHSLSFYFNKNNYGLEYGALQFDIVSDRDVEGYWLIEFYGNAGDTTVVHSKFDFALTANEKKTITIDFENNFMFGKNVDYGCLDILFKTDLHEGGPSWQEWAKTKYTISNWVISINN